MQGNESLKNMTNILLEMIMVKLLSMLLTFKSTIQFYFLKHEIGVSFLHFVIFTNLIFLFSCKTNNLYHNSKISKISFLSYEIANKKIIANEIKSRFASDSLLFLNPYVCNLLENHYSDSLVLHEILLSCQKLDQIFESQNEDKLLATKIGDSINKLHHWDQKVRTDILQFESNNPSQIKDRKLIDSIDAISMNFINHYFKSKFYEVYLKPAIYKDLYILMLHDLGKEKSNDALILNLYLRGFEKGFFSKQEIFAAISRYLWLSTGKLDFNFDFLFENIKSTDSYQVKYSKEVVKRILSNNEKYGFNNR
jgi:hypothetical protein